mmetsp:Transcript_29590/g.85664  ORF Transcript_29590/g.85664 Transcript_29590/m.85664 type:complete len:265 (-) Transcript_29590:718-1512(-)
MSVSASVKSASGLARGESRSGRPEGREIGLIPRAFVALPGQLAPSFWVAQYLEQLPSRPLGNELDGRTVDGVAQVDVRHGELQLIEQGCLHGPHILHRPRTVNGEGVLYGGRSGGEMAVSIVLDTVLQKLDRAQTEGRLFFGVLGGHGGQKPVLGDVSLLTSPEAVVVAERHTCRDGARGTDEDHLCVVLVTLVILVSISRDELDVGRVVVVDHVEQGHEGGHRGADCGVVDLDRSRHRQTVNGIVLCLAELQLRSLVCRQCLE